MYLSFWVTLIFVGSMGCHPAFTHGDHDTVNPWPVDKGLIQSPARCCTVPPVVCNHQESTVPIIKSVLQGEVTSPTPNPQYRGPGFSVGGFLPLVTGSSYLKVPNTPTAAQLLAAASCH